MWFLRTPPLINVKERARAFTIVTRKFSTHHKEHPMKHTLLIAITAIALGLTGAARVGTLHALDKPAAKPPTAMPMDRDMQPMMEQMMHHQRMSSPPAIK